MRHQNLNPKTMGTKKISKPGFCFSFKKNRWYRLMRRKYELPDLPLGSPFQGTRYQGVDFEGLPSDVDSEFYIQRIKSKPGEHDPQFYLFEEGVYKNEEVDFFFCVFHESLDKKEHILIKKKNIENLSLIEPKVFARHLKSREWDLIRELGEVRGLCKAHIIRTYYK